MIKRILMILMSLLLLCGASAWAEEATLYEKIDNAMYLIILRTEAEDVTLGSGVLFQDQHLLLTALGCCAEGDLYAIGNDGEHAITNWSAMENTDIALLEMATPSTAEPLQISNTDSQSLPFIFGTNAEGQISTMPMYLARYDMYNGQESLLLSSEESLLPGAFMTDAKGQLIGLVIAQHMEGVGNYVVLDANTISSALMGKTDAGEFLDTSIAWIDGIMMITWNDVSRSSGVYIITISGDYNEYYTTFEADKAERSYYLAVPPGHTYYVQVQWAESEAQALPMYWDAMKTFTIPETTFNAYSFAQESYLASTPAGQTVTTTLPEMPLISVDTLTDPRTDVYLQIKNTYDVSAEIDAAMALELIAPDEQFFFEEMVYTFSPDHEENDSFAVLLDNLLATCVEFSGGVLQQGSYMLRYALRGQIAGEYAFTVQPAGTPQTESGSMEENPQTLGFASGMTAVNENGLITLSWDAASIPESAKINLYYLYEGNPFVTCIPIEEGISTTQVFSVPGFQMAAWAVWSTIGDPIPVMPENKDEYAAIPAAELLPLTDHSFQNLRIGVTPSDDPQAGTRTEFLPEVPLTREILADRDTPIYFQTEDTYRISETSTDHPMEIVFSTPEGMIFVDPGYYIFDTTLQSSDLWLKDISKLFADYEAFVKTSAWPAGEYRILYIIDEKLAGEFSFTLE